MQDEFRRDYLMRLPLPLAQLFAWKIADDRNRGRLKSAAQQIFIRRVRFGRAS